MQQYGVQLVKFEDLPCTGLRVVLPRSPLVAGTDVEQNVVVLDQLKDWVLRDLQEQISETGHAAHIASSPSFLYRLMNPINVPARALAEYQRAPKPPGIWHWMTAPYLGSTGMVRAP